MSNTGKVPTERARDFGTCDNRTTWKLTLSCKAYLCCHCNLTAHTCVCIQEKRKPVSKHKSSQALHRHGRDSVTGRRVLISAPAWTRQQNIIQTTAAWRKKKKTPPPVTAGTGNQSGLKDQTRDPQVGSRLGGKDHGRLLGWWRPPLSCLGDAHTDMWNYQSPSNCRICGFYSVSIMFKFKKMINVSPWPTQAQTRRPLDCVLLMRQGGLHGVCPPVSGPRAAASVTVWTNEVRITTSPGFSPMLPCHCSHRFQPDLSKSLSIGHQVWRQDHPSHWTGHTLCWGRWSGSGSSGHAAHVQNQLKSLHCSVPQCPYL